MALGPCSQQKSNFKTVIRTEFVHKPFFQYYLESMKNKKASEAFIQDFGDCLKIGVTGFEPAASTSRIHYVAILHIFIVSYILL